MTANLIIEIHISGGKERAVNIVNTHAAVIDKLGPGAAGTPSDSAVGMPSGHFEFL